MSLDEEKRKDSEKLDRDIIPDRYRSHLPAPRASHFIVPISGLLLALTFLVGSEFVFEKWRFQYGVEKNDQSPVLGILDRSTAKIVDSLKDRASDIRRGVIVVSGGLEGLRTDNNLAFVSEVSPAQVSSAGEGFGYFWSALKHNVSFYFSSIAQKWRDFLAGRSKQAVVSPQIDESALREEIKQEVLQDLLRELDQLLVGGEISDPSLIDGPDGSGLVVVPDNGQDRDQIIRQIQSMFSDQVRIQLDSTGRSGVVTPVFRGQPGRDYIFVLTPINR